MTRFEVVEDALTDTCKLLCDDRVVMSLDAFEYDWDDTSWDAACDVLERVADALNELALKPKIVRDPPGDATYLVG